MSLILASLIAALFILFLACLIALLKLKARLLSARRCVQMHKERFDFLLSELSDGAIIMSNITDVCAINDAAAALTCYKEGRRLFFFVFDARFMRVLNKRINKTVDCNINGKDYSVTFCFGTNYILVLFREVLAHTQPLLFTLPPFIPPSSAQTQSEMIDISALTKKALYETALVLKDKYITVVSDIENAVMLMDKSGQIQTAVESTVFNVADMAKTGSVLFARLNRKRLVLENDGLKHNIEF